MWCANLTLSFNKLVLFYIYEYVIKVAILNHMNTPHYFNISPVVGYSVLESLKFVFKFSKKPKNSMQIGITTEKWGHRAVNA